MNCTDFEIRDYFFNELPEAERDRAARHVSACSACAGELDGLRHLRFALESIPDSEPPQRIGFVSDKVFEPSRPRRLWNAFWDSAPRLGFASAAMISAALVTYSLHPRTVTIQYSLPVAAASVNVAPLVDEAVRKAVADTEVRQQRRTDLLLAAAARKQQSEQRELLLRVADSYNMLQKRTRYTRASLLDYGGADSQ